MLYKLETLLFFNLLVTEIELLVAEFCVGVCRY
jgi:hypothetical protein